MADKDAESTKKHPLAIAWDEWLASDEGQAARDANTLPHGSIYLENRLYRAFMAGAKAGATSVADEVIQRTQKDRKS